MAIRPYKRGGVIDPRRWQIDFYDSDKKRQRMVFEGSRAEAEALAADLRKRHTRGPLVNPTISKILPEYLTWMRNHRAARTVADIELCLKKLEPHFGHYPVNRITRSLIEDYISARKRAGRVTAQGRRIGEIKPSGINKELNYLSGIISWMVDNDYSHPLPFKIQKLKTKRPLPQVPGHQEIERFLAVMAAADPGKGLIAALIYDSGLRWNEVTKLKWEDINWQTGDILIMGKGSKERMQILSPRCRAALEPLRAAAGSGSRAAAGTPTGYVFKNPRTGKPYTTLRAAFKKAGLAAGVKINPHLLRHAWATYTLEATGDMRLVQIGLGHADIATTQIYTHISNSRLRTGAQQRQKYLDKQTPETPPDTPETSIPDDQTVIENTGKVIDITSFFNKR